MQISQRYFIATCTHLTDKCIACFWFTIVFIQTSLHNGQIFESTIKLKQSVSSKYAEFLLFTDVCHQQITENLLVKDVRQKQIYRRFASDRCMSVASSFYITDRSRAVLLIWFSVSLVWVLVSVLLSPKHLGNIGS